AGGCGFCRGGGDRSRRGRRRCPPQLSVDGGPAKTGHSGRDLAGRASTGDAQLPHGAAARRADGIGVAALVSEGGRASAERDSGGIDKRASSEARSVARTETEVGRHTKGEGGARIQKEVLSPSFASPCGRGAERVVSPPCRRYCRRASREKKGKRHGTDRGAAIRDGTGGPPG